MRRGEIWLARFDPAQGSEVTKTRPCVIVSNDASNRVVERLRRGVITVVPLTSNTARVYDFQTLIKVTGTNGLAVDSKAQAEQIRSLNHERLVERLGQLPREVMAALDAAIAVHLSLDL
ncbi:MAG: type II toxin-antitoxin system PemK/MazF family toxin [Propionibacteriaceae bacterium]|jgi:mRNA interferase MazF|nr:type II toxin-antitoxin system PemK/MazF family toxin [Propionibacteriaceae bacterium]